MFRAVEYSSESQVVKCRSEQEFTSLFNRIISETNLYKWLHRVAYRAQSRNALEPQEVVHRALDKFLSYYSRGGRYKELNGRLFSEVAAMFKGYLRTIMFRVCYDDFRDVQKSPGTLDEEATETVVDNRRTPDDEVFMYREQLEQVLDFILEEVNPRRRKDLVDSIQNTANLGTEEAGSFDILDEKMLAVLEGDLDSNESANRRGTNVHRAREQVRKAFPDFLN